MGIYMDEPESLHLYTYCKNDGVNMVDPSGHWGKEESKTILKFHFQFKKRENNGKVAMPTGHSQTASPSQRQTELPEQSKGEKVSLDIAFEYALG